jgi:hypothetical protein
MDQNVTPNLEQIGREAAEYVAGAENVEQVEVVEKPDSTEKLAYYFTFLIEQDRDRLSPGHLNMQIARRLRDALTALGDYRYPFVRILNRRDWVNHGRA